MHYTQEQMNKSIEFLEKAKKDISRLQKKTITDKNGKRRIIYVSRPEAEQPALFETASEFQTWADNRPREGLNYTKPVTVENEHYPTLIEALDELEATRTSPNPRRTSNEFMSQMKQDAQGPDKLHPSERKELNDMYDREEEHMAEYWKKLRGEAVELATKLGVASFARDLGDPTKIPNDNMHNIVAQLQRDLNSKQTKVGPAIGEQVKTKQGTSGTLESLSPSGNYAVVRTSTGPKSYHLSDLL